MGIRAFSTLGDCLQHANHGHIMWWFGVVNGFASLMEASLGYSHPPQAAHGVMEASGLSRTLLVLVE